jgi:hypothetical protein
VDSCACDYLNISLNGIKLTWFLMLLSFYKSIANQGGGDGFSEIAQCYFSAADVLRKIYFRSLNLDRNDFK